MATPEQDIPILADPVAEITCPQCQALLDVSGFPAFYQTFCPECKTELALPGRLGNFLLTSLIGRGGMGAVFQGIDESLNRPVAIKVLLRSYGDDQEFVATFKREAQSAAALNHPHVVQIYSFGVEKGQPYIAMELLSGGRLDAMIAAGKPLDQALIFKIAAEVAEGLNAANAIGLIHGDIKPENILLDANGNAKVVDFGLAYFRDRGARTDGIWGTPFYIAPEKVRRQPSDARADIYSLGATLFHALAGKPPFDGNTPLDVVKARLDQPPPSLKAVRPDIHPEVEVIIRRMLEPEPAKRYPTYVSLLADIRPTLAKLGPAAPVQPAIQSKKKGGKIVLTKSKSGGTIIASTGGTGGQATTGRSGGEPGGGATAAPQADEQTRRRRRRRVWLWIGIIVLALVVIGGGVLFVRRYQAKEKRNEDVARQNAALAALAAKAAEKYSEMNAFLTNVAARVSAVDVKLQSETTRVADILALVGAGLGSSDLATVAPTNATDLGSQINAQVGILKPSWKNLQRLEKQALEKQSWFGLGNSPVLTNAVALPLLAMPTEAAYAPGPITAAAPDATAALTNAAAGTNEAAVTTNAAPVAPANPPPAPGVAQPPAAPAVPAAAPAPEATPAAAPAGTDVVSRTSAALEELFATLSAMLPDATNVSTATYIIQTGLRQLQLLNTNVAAAATFAAADAKRQQELRAESERKAAEDAEAKRKTEAEKELGEQEKKRVKDAVAANLERVRKNQFKEAGAALQSGLSDLTTAAGKKDFKAAADRLTLLQELKEFVIAGIGREVQAHGTYRYGWLVGNVPTLDVLSADESQVEIKGGRKVPWDEVSILQMMKFIGFFTNNRDLRSKERGRMNVAAAVYFFESGGGDKKALELAGKRAAEALTFDAGLKEQIATLMPDLVLP
jgi:hypothetical protein